jgi:hypothetical protein
MLPLVVVVVYKCLDAAMQVMSIITRLKIHVFMFQGPEKPLNPYVINGASFAIHGYTDVLKFLDCLHIFLRGKLAALIRVNDPRLPMLFNGRFDELNHPTRLHAI